ncbi:hypothetical protein [Paractinoplanes durhamensis]|uniref:Uncharacterized protein n=1 Tax=Paractinoplanes durhamensis TaxID=113563 RepID=A0ABQ3YW59_9ACTN|nr:hypothetical protein [Actinoplanes durhamensis]GIE01830.1 hypothetical protein Adu01nite_31800 [Actinoplanes durhamensis]
MSLPRTAESTIVDTFLTDPDTWRELLILVDEVGEGEDGGGSHSPPADDESDAGSEADVETTAEEAEQDTGTGEDGGGSHTPPKEQD